MAGRLQCHGQTKSSSLFRRYTIINTDRIHAVNKEDIPLNERINYKCQKPASVMVWAGVTSTSEKTPLIFIEEGAKINQHVYLNMLNEQLVPCINASFKESGTTIQQDGATSHTVNLVQEWCNKNMTGFWTLLQRI